MISCRTDLVVVVLFQIANVSSLLVRVDHSYNFVTMRRDVQIVTLIGFLSKRKKKEKKKKKKEEAKRYSIRLPIFKPV